MLRALRLTPAYAALSAALASMALPAAAQSPIPPSAQALQGQTVRGAKGVVLGVVERVTLTPGGRPAQILVRPKGLRPGGMHSLAVSSVIVGPDGLTAPITKAEFDAMPPIDVSEP